MAAATIKWSHRLGGGTPAIREYVCGEAVKKGDVVVDDADGEAGTAGYIARMDASAEKVIGVAIGDGADGDTVPVVLATALDVFEFTTSTDGFTDGTDNNNLVDMAVFTSGSMSADCSASSNDDILAIDLVDGETSGSIGNKFLGIFQTRHF